MTVQVLYQGITRPVRCEPNWTVVDLLIQSVIAFSISCRGQHAWSTMVFRQEDGYAVDVLHGRKLDDWFKEGELVALSPGMIP